MDSHEYKRLVGEGGRAAVEVPLNKGKVKKVVAAGRAVGTQTTLSRRQFMGLMASCGLIVAGPGMLSACGKSGGAQSSELRVLGQENFPPNWNPYGHFLLSGYKVQANLYDRLVELTPDLSLEPGLAEEWEQVDERTWEFSLRDNVKFHDGKAFTPEDVKASIELASGFANADPPPTTASWWVPHEVEVVDERTVRLRSEEPFAPLLITLAITDILSSELIGKGVRALEEGPPNGTGPFRLADDGDSSNEKSFDAFRAYFGRPAQMDRLLLEYVSDAQTRLNSLLSDQASIVDTVDRDQGRAIEGRDDVTLDAVPSVEILQLYFRMDKKPFGDNSALRRAVAWGVDREALVGVVGGETQLATSHLATRIPYSTAQEPLYTFDPERARSELEKAGVGTPVPFEFAVAPGSYSKTREVGELITENLNEVGFDVKLTLLEVAAWNDLIVGEEKRAEVFLAGWASVSPDPDWALIFNYYSKSGAPWGYNNKRIDELIEEGRRTTDDGQREQVYVDLQAALWEQLPTVPLYYTENSAALRSNVDGFDLYPNFLNRYRPVSVVSEA